MTRAEIRGLTFIRDSGPVWAVDSFGSHLIPGVASGAFRLMTFENQGLITVVPAGWEITAKGREVLAQVEHAAGRDLA